MSSNSLVSPNWFHPRHFEHKWDIMFRNMLDCYFQLICLATSAYLNQGLAYKCHIQSKFLSFFWVALKKIIYIYLAVQATLRRYLYAVRKQHKRMESDSLSLFFFTFTLKKVLISHSDLPSLHPHNIMHQN